VQAAKKALRLFLRTVVGDKVESWEYRTDQELNLSWVTEFFFKISPSIERITDPEVFYNGSVRHVSTQAKPEEFSWTTDFVSPSSTNCYRPRLSSTFRSHLSPELHQEVLV
jgi:hypothetical protein